MLHGLERGGVVGWRALAELQRELIVANTRDGLAAARAPGCKGGRRPKLNADQAMLAQQLYYGGDRTVQQIADVLSLPRSLCGLGVADEERAPRAVTTRRRSRRGSGLG